MPTNSASFSNVDLVREILSNYENSSSIKRLFHGRGNCYEGFEHITVDFYPPLIYVRFFKSDEELKKFFVEEFTNKNSFKVVLHNVEESTFEYINIDSIDLGKHISSELGLKYLLKIGENQNIGFFPDMILAREWMLNNKGKLKDKKVLNLFAYTCSISVVAKYCGASEIHNVDLSSSFLSWGRENHRLNFKDDRGVYYHKKNIMKSLGFLSKKGPFDFIFFDPPSFQKGSFDYKKDYVKVLRRLDEMCDIDGVVFSCLNTPFEKDDFVKKLFDEELPNFNYVETIFSPKEFKELDKNKGVKICIYQKMRHKNV